MTQTPKTDFTTLKPRTVVRLFKQAANRRDFALFRYAEAHSRLAAANEQYAEVEQLALTMSKWSEADEH
jgi:hypothetical protein